MWTATAGASERRHASGRTARSLVFLAVASAVAAGVLLIPYTAGVSRQHSSAASYWLSGGCPEDDGEAWSSEPVDRGATARRECRSGAVARSAVAAGMLTTAGVAMLLGQIQLLRRLEEDA